MPTQRDRTVRSDSFSAEHVTALFSEMSATYGRLNLISSFGFSHFWRAACVRELAAERPVHCADLMCGGAEAALLLRGQIPAGSTIVACDFCPEMCRLAESSVSRRGAAVEVELRDVFSIPAAARFDRIVCSFGLKTLSDDQLERFARSIHSWLLPGGVAAFVEIHVPRRALLRLPYLFYLRSVIPLLGRIAQRNAECYRWLARYTEDFAARDSFEYDLRRAGLRCHVRPLFLGCARLYVAVKPA